VIQGEAVPAYDEFRTRAIELIRQSGSNSVALRKLEQEYGVTAAEARKLITTVDEQVLAYANATDQYEQTTEASNELTGATEETTAAGIESVNAAEDQEEAYKALREEIEDNIKAQEDLLDAQMSTVDAQFGYESAVRDTVTAIADWTEANEDVELSESEKAEALQDATEQAWDQAGAALKLAEDWAEANDETLTAKQKQQILRDELLKVARTLAPNDPLRKNIIGLAEDISDVPTDWETEITADASQAEREVGDHLKYLDRQEPVARAAGREVGQAAADGIYDGLTSKEWFIKRTMTEYVRSMIDAAKNELDIRSPSQVMADEVGVPVAEGIAQGVEDGAELVEDALSDLGDSIIERSGEIVRDSIDEIERVLDAAEDAFDEAQDLIENRRDHEDAVRRVEDAERDLVDAEKAVQRALQDSGADSEEYRRAQDDLKDAQLDLEDANYRLLQVSYDLIEQGPAGAAMFENIAQAAGLTRTEIQKLIDKYRELQTAKAEAEQAQAVQRPVEQAEQQVTNQANYQAELDSAIAAYQDKIVEINEALSKGQSTQSIESQMASLAIKAAQAYAGLQGYAPGSSGNYKAQLDLLRYLVTNQNYLVDNTSSYVKALEAAVPGYATGGIVTRPTLAMIGEKGPEAVIPLSKMNDRATVMNIYISGADPNQVVDALKRYARQNGAIPVRTINP